MGRVIDTSPEDRQCLMPSVGLEIKLLLKFSGPAPKTHLMKRLVNKSKYSWQYGDEITREREQDEEQEEEGQGDNEEELL